MSNRVDVKVIADSIAFGSRLTTLELEYPRYIHSEFMTHRVFSRNAQSSRAIPIHKAINKVIGDKWYPIFMKNQPGMVAIDSLSGYDLDQAKNAWDYAKETACANAWELEDLGIHKQIVSRVIEPFSKIKVIVSATDWNNFFRLRIAPDAQQEMQELAVAIRDEMLCSDPISMEIFDWHLPYITDSDFTELRGNLELMKKVSVARCARVSYLNHDKRLDYQKDLELFDRLWRSKHLSPFEHVATPWPNSVPTGNFKGWKQLRWNLENDISA